MRRKLITDNLNEVVRILFRYYGLKFDGYAKSLYHSHPRYGYIESISYVLSRFGLDTSLVQTDLDEIKDFPFPLILHYDGLFLPIIGVKDNDTFIIINESGENEEIVLGGFVHLWDSRALVIEEDGKGLENKVRDRTVWGINHFVTLLSCLVIAGLVIYLSANVISLHSVIRCLFMLSSIVGLSVSALFHVQKLNRGNPFINRICHPSANHSSKRDCSSILDSTASKLFGIFSWVDIGTFYFIVFLFVIWFMQRQGTIITLAIISLFAAVYIPYSLFYQAKIAKRWCTLCLLVQGVLLFNALLSIVVILKECLVLRDLIMTAVRIVVMSLILFPLYYFVSNSLSSSYSFKQKNKKYRQYLFSAEGINSIIYQTPEVDFTCSNKMPVIKREGSAELTMIINPLCSPCINKTREVIEILKRKRYTSLYVVFLVDPKSTSEVAQASRLITDSMAGQLASSLENYTKRYRGVCNAESNVSFCPESSQIIESSFRWCQENNYMSTPKTFLNNHELPSLFSVNDIDYLIE